MALAVAAAVCAGCATGRIRTVRRRSMKADTVVVMQYRQQPDGSWKLIKRYEENDPLEMVPGKGRP